MATAGKKANILIVDDEELVRRVLRKKLSKEGYRCQEAGDAYQALDRLRGNPVDLAILDVRMPGKTGDELLPEIRDGYPGTAVIMATAAMETTTVVRCMKEGAHDYITKPFDLDEILASVERALKKKGLELRLKEYRQNLEHEVHRLSDQTRHIFLGAVESLVSALEASDEYTAGHSRRVATIAVGIGRELGLTPVELEELEWGGLLHDVGKIGIDPAIQNKRGPLTAEEYEQMMLHTSLGPDIVKPLANESIVEMIRHHHDRFDGSDGSGPGQTVAGEGIPLGARILAVADTFDAMTSRRPYREALSLEEAISEIRQCAGTQFDPAVVAAFLKAPIADIVQAQT